MKCPCVKVTFLGTESNVKYSLPLNCMKVKLLLFVFILTGVSIQFIQISDDDTHSIEKADYIVNFVNNEQVAHIINESCYDCHSNRSNYPWHAKVAPVSWYLRYNIKKGREHLNFSEWGNYSDKQKKRSIDKCLEKIENSQMPLKTYVLIHRSAKIDSHKKQVLKSWFLSRKGDNLML